MSDLELDKSYADMLCQAAEGTGDLTEDELEKYVREWLDTPDGMAWLAHVFGEKNGT